jgi:hypothetical protein
MPAFTHSSADAARKPNTKTVEQDAVSHLDALVAALRLAWEADPDRHAAKTEAKAPRRTRRHPRRRSTK